MTYLSIAKDMETTKKRHDLMKQLTRLNAKYGSFWIDKEEIIAPFNEKQIKDSNRDTLDDFLIAFNGVVSGFQREGMLPEHIDHYYNKFNSKEDINHYLDIGYVRTMSKFFNDVAKKLHGRRRILKSIATKLEEFLTTTDPTTGIENLNLKRQDISMLQKGSNSLIPQYELWLGVLPTVSKEHLYTLKGDDLREVLKPLAEEYRYLEEYFTGLIVASKDEQIRYEEDFITNQYALNTLDTRMEHFKGQLLDAFDKPFSELQRTLVAKFYMDNKESGTIRQGLDGESATKDLLVRYDTIMYLLYAEYGIKDTINSLNHIIYKSRYSTETLSDLEMRLYDIYQTVALEISTKVMKYESIKYGVLEHKHITILTLFMELNRTVADIIYRNPTFSGLFLNLQSVTAHFFVQLNPTNSHIAENLKVFPFKLGDGVIENFLISKGFDLPQPEPTVEDLLDIITKRNNLAIDLDKGFGSVLSSLHKVLDREEQQQMEEHYSEAQDSFFSKVKHIVDTGHDTRVHLKTYN